MDVLPYTTLMYGNGPGHKITNGTRPDIRDVNTSETNSMFLCSPYKNISDCG